MVKVRAILLQNTAACGTRPSHITQEKTYGFRNASCCGSTTTCLAIGTAVNRLRFRQQMLCWSNNSATLMTTKDARVAGCSRCLPCQKENPGTKFLYSIWSLIVVQVDLKTPYIDVVCRFCVSNIMSTVAISSATTRYLWENHFSNARSTSYWIYDGNE